MDVWKGAFIISAETKFKTENFIYFLMAVNH